MKTLEQLRRDAKALRKAHEAGEKRAIQRIASVRPRDDGADLKHADYLHVIARETGFASWPRLVFAVETHGLDQAETRQRLMIALFHGQSWRVEALLAEIPDMAEGDFHLACALYDQKQVAAALETEPGQAVEAASDRVPLIWLATSRFVKARPDLEGDMLAVAELLVEHGADVNAGQNWAEGHALSPLYFAMAGDNMALVRWLLEHGADPDDGESLYHATELGHREGIRLLLKHGADPKGTNALLRAMDFDDLDTVQMLMAAGADADGYNSEHVGGEAPWVYPALHQAARRMCSREMAEVLLAGGADPERIHDGATAYALARAFGNAPVAEVLAAHGARTKLSPAEQALADVADGKTAKIDPETLPSALRDLIRSILHLPGKLDHVKRLVAAGLPFDQPDGEGLTPVQIAGWEGLPDVLEYLLSLGPDLTHINGYGGTLLSTIIHGSENNPSRDGRDYTGCVKLALEAGVALPKRAIGFAGDPEVAAFLADWAESHPGQVTEEGVV